MVVLFGGSDDWLDDYLRSGVGLLRGCDGDRPGDDGGWLSSGVLWLDGKVWVVVIVFVWPWLVWMVV